MNLATNKMPSNLSATEFIERRNIKNRRAIIDQRKNIRFDSRGGERRANSGRRSNDNIFEIIEMMEA